MARGAPRGARYALTGLAVIAASACSCAGDLEPNVGAGGSVTGGVDNGTGATGGGSGGTGGTVIHDAGGAGSDAFAVDSGLPDGWAAGGWWDDSLTDWKAVPWAPPACPYRYAVEPAKVAPPLDWQPCPGGAPGCEMFVVEVPAGEPLLDLQVHAFGSGYRIGLRVFLNYARPKHPTVVLYEPDGVPTFVLREAGTQGCGSYAPVVSESTVCAGLSQYGEVGLDLSLACGDAAEIPSMPKPTRVTGAPQRMWLHDGLLTLWGPPTAVYDIAPDKLTVLEATDTLFFRPKPFGSYVGLEGYVNGPTTGYVWSRTQGLQRIVDRSPQEVYAMDGDGTSLFWLQGDPQAQLDGPTANASIWRSPLATSAAELQPQKVRDLGTVNVPLTIAGNGYWLLAKELAHLDLYRMSDGHHWMVPMPEGYIWKTFLQWADDQYLFYGIGTPATKTIGMVRQRVDALGPGD
jgi:hypothetical protein